MRSVRCRQSWQRNWQDVGVSFFLAVSHVMSFLFLKHLCRNCDWQISTSALREIDLFFGEKNREGGEEIITAHQRDIPPRHRTLTSGEYTCANKPNIIPLLISSSISVSCCSLISQLILTLISLILSPLVLSISVLKMSLCHPTLYKNKKNFKGTLEHDKNPRKHWFLVLGTGLFTFECVYLLFHFEFALTYGFCKAGRTVSRWPAARPSFPAARRRRAALDGGLHPDA